MNSEFLLSLADNALILGHRNSEWCGHGPVLEQDIAITNISLDLIGQARNFYQLAASRMSSETTEDTLAYFRNDREFRNCLIMELPKGDWAFTTLRQFLVSNFQFRLYTKLAQSGNEELAAIAAKALKEVSYHLRWSSEWVIRLGDGTDESRARMENALTEIWPYTGELFMPAAFESSAETGFDLAALQPAWMEEVATVFDEAGLSLPATEWMHSGGKTGIHTEYMGYILAEMQSVARAHPDAQW